MSTNYNNYTFSIFKMNIGNCNNYINKKKRKKL